MSFYDPIIFDRLWNKFLMEADDQIISEIIACRIKGASFDIMLSYLPSQFYGKYMLRFSIGCTECKYNHTFDYKSKKKLTIKERYIGLSYTKRFGKSIWEIK